MALDVGPIPDNIAGSIIDFDIKTPPPELTLANIKHAHSLGLRRSNQDAPVLRIIANGPSSRLAPLDGPTLALNGALGLFFNTGRVPTYWAACDPQALVAGFIPDSPPMDTIYLPASKCHPSVFDKLQGRDVRLWDVSDFVDTNRPVPCASSITLCAFALMLQRGWSRFEVWGWDCSFLDGAHHAVEQDHQAPEVIEVECDSRTFQTTRSWLAEAQDAANAIKPIYDYLGIEIVLKGDGFLRTFLGGSKASIQTEGTNQCPVFTPTA